MYLERLRIRNFRCFNRYDVEFAPRVTVLFGKNGTGKTTLIHAIHKALSFMMYSERIKGKDPETGRMKVIGTHSVVKDNPYQHVEGFAKQGDWYTTDEPLIEIEANATMSGILSPELRVPLNWAISAYTNKSVLRYSEFRDAFTRFFDWYQKTDELPLLCYFSDSFPHREDVHHKQLKKKISGFRSFGYYNWNEESGNTKEWVGRLENDIREIDRVERRIRTMVEIAQNPYEKDLDKIASYKDTIAADELYKQDLVREVKLIENLIRDFASKLVIDGKRYMDVVAIGLHPEDDKLCLHLANGKFKSFRQLPAGYKRLFGIVLDIAYRSLLLNPNRGTDSRGIAIIDEIDLHLHPELEKIALEALVETFPNLQFIVSTHSPVVLSGLKTTDGQNKILRLSLGEETPSEIPDVYGLDYNSIVQEIMNVGASNPELQRWISRCAYLYKNSFIEQGDALKRQIIERGLLSQETLELRINEAMRKLR